MTIFFSVVFSIRLLHALEVYLKGEHHHVGVVRPVPARLQHGEVSATQDIITSEQIRETLKARVKLVAIQQRVVVVVGHAGIQHIPTHEQNLYTTNSVFSSYVEYMYASIV